MHWDIKPKNESAQYTLGDESYEIQIALVEQTFSSAPGFDHKMPDDILINAIYRAESDHGLFEWTVNAEIAHDSASGDVIDDVKLTKKPENSSLLAWPIFTIEIHD